MSVNAPDTSLFDEKMVEAMESAATDSVINQHQEQALNGRESILEAEIVDISESSSVNEKHAHKAKKLSTKQTKLIFLGAVSAVFVGTVFMFSPANNESSVSGVGHAVYNENGAVSSQFVPAPLAMKEVEKPPVQERETPKGASNSMPVHIAEGGKELITSDAQSHTPPLNTQDAMLPKAVAENEKPLVPQIDSNDASKISDHAQIEALTSQIAALVKVISDSKAAPLKTDVVKPSESVAEPKKKGMPIMGYAIGVVRILEDGVVFKSGEDLKVVKIGESYKSYGVLVSVSPNKNTFVTTRGLWRVKL